MSKSINSHGLLNKTWFNKTLYGLFKRRFCLTWFIEKETVTWFISHKTKSLTSILRPIPTRLSHEAKLHVETEQETAACNKSSMRMTVTIISTELIKS